MKAYNVMVKDFREGKRQIIVYKNPMVICEDDEDHENKSLEWHARNDCKEEKEITEEILESRFLKSLDNIKRAKKAVYDLARCNKWDWFVTLTFSPDNVDRTDYKACKGKLQKWLNNMRNRYSPNMKYLFIPEMHEKIEKNGKRAWHFHGLMADCEKLDFKEAKDFYTDENIFYEGNLVYNLTKWKNGFSTATKIRDTDRASSYVTKYFTKEMQAYVSGQRRYLPFFEFRPSSCSKIVC